MIFVYYKEFLVACFPEYLHAEEFCSFFQFYYAGLIVDRYRVQNPDLPASAYHARYTSYVKLFNTHLHLSYELTSCFSFNDHFIFDEQVFLQEVYND